MKKLLIFGIVFVFAVAVICIVVFANGGKMENVAVLDGLKFGMSPSEVKQVMGNPDSQDLFEESNTLRYRYSTTLDGEPAEITLSFQRIFFGRHLNSVYIVANPETEEATDAFAHYMAEKIRAEYSNMDGYYEETSEIKTDLGISYGATGVYFSVEMKNGNVIIDGTKLQ